MTVYTQSLKNYIHILWSGVLLLRGLSKEIILHFHKENSTLYNKALTWDNLNVYQLVTGSKWCSVQYGSVTQLCLTFCDPKTAALQASLSITNSWSLLKLVSIESVITIQPFHPLLFPSPAFNLSQHQGLFKWISSSHHMAKVLEFQLQHQSFQWIFRTDFL